MATTLKVPTAKTLVWAGGWLGGDCFVGGERARKGGGKWVVEEVEEAYKIADGVFVGFV
jgi:hypothetical protein